jgi:hypothetical protein
MGTEYERWLIARGNVFSPSAEGVVKLIAKLREEGWLPRPGSPELAQLQFRGRREQYGQSTGAFAVRRIENTFGEGREALFAKIAASTESVPVSMDAAWLKDPAREDVNLVWLVSAEATSLKYPLTRRPDGPTHYRFELHLAADFVYPISETIDALATDCRCGNDLSFEWDPEEYENPFGATSGITTACTDCSRTFDPAAVSATVKNPFDESEEDLPGGAAYRFALKIDCGKSFVRAPDLAFSPELVELVGQEFGRSFYEVGSVY